MAKEEDKMKRYYYVNKSREVEGPITMHLLRLCLLYFALYKRIIMHAMLASAT